MKKLLLMLSCCLTTWCNAQTWLKYDTSSSANSSIPQRTVESVSDGVVVTYRFSGATIAKDDLYKTANTWDIEGFEHISDTALPDLLQKVDYIQIPNGKNATVSLINSSSFDYNCELAPSRPDIIDDGNGVGYTKDIVKPISSYSGFYPLDIVYMNIVGQTL